MTKRRNRFQEARTAQQNAAKGQNTAIFMAIHQANRMADKEIRKATAAKDSYWARFKAWVGRVVTKIKEVVND